MLRQFQPGCPCCSRPSPQTLPVCVIECNGKRMIGAHVVVVDSDGNTVLEDTTDSLGCTRSITWENGIYTATVTPPQGIPGWEITTKIFTMPGGLTNPILVRLSDGYSCGCLNPGDRNIYLGVGPPRKQLGESLFFSSEVGSCTLQWYPWKPNSPWGRGIYYGHLMVEGFASAPSYKNDGYVKCKEEEPKQGLLEVFFGACGINNCAWVSYNRCYRPGNVGFAFCDHYNLAFGIRCFCACRKCHVVVPPDYELGESVCDPNQTPCSDPHDYEELYVTPPNDFADTTGWRWMGPLQFGNTMMQRDPFIYAADHTEAYSGFEGPGVGSCTKQVWFPAGTVVISE